MLIVGETLKLLLPVHHIKWDSFYGLNMDTITLFVEEPLGQYGIVHRGAPLRQTVWWQ